MLSPEVYGPVASFPAASAKASLLAASPFFQPKSVLVAWLSHIVPDGSYHIANRASQRWLYAHAAGAWEDRVGAARRIDHRVGSAQWYFVFVAMNAEQ